MVTLDEAKVHLRVSYTSDDAYITGLIEAATDYVEVVGVPSGSPIPAPIRHAILLLVGHWFSNREAAGETPSAPIAFGVNALLAPYREHSL